MRSVPVLGHSNARLRKDFSYFHAGFPAEVAVLEDRRTPQSTALILKTLPTDFRLPVVTADGVFVAHYSARGLSGLDFPSARNSAKSSDAKVPDTLRLWHRQTSAAVKNALSGRILTDLPPLDLSRGTEFQLSVWTSLLKIKSGRTQSYGEIAKSIGKPKAVRAVGGACGANPIPLLVPCHRVLAANRKIGGFSGGLGWKEKLLAREGVSVAG